MNLEEITKIIWGETLLFNIRTKKKSPSLKDFRWCCWSMMETKKPEHCLELLSWVHYLILNDLPVFCPIERHEHAVDIRKKAGWKIGERRNEVMKTDPFLIPFKKCPDDIQEWLVNKDRIMLDILKQNWRQL